MDLNLMSVKIEPQVTAALVIAYCINLDASTACTVHVLILLKQKVELQKQIGQPFFMGFLMGCNRKSYTILDK
jgi:hypothetical protein